MKTIRGKQQGWLLPFCLVYLAVGTTVIMVELDRVILLLRQMDRITKREMVLVEMETDLQQIQALNRTAVPSFQLPAIVNEGSTQWSMKDSAYPVMVPAWQAEEGRCYGQAELTMGTAMSFHHQREDGGSVYRCEWYASGEQVQFYVPGIHW